MDEHQDIQGEHQAGQSFEPENPPDKNSPDYNDTAENLGSTAALKQVSPKEKSNKMWLWVLIIVLLLGGGGAAAWYYTNDDQPAVNDTSQTDNSAAISSYEDCVAAGHSIMESFPEQCAVPGGETFTRTLTPEEEIQNSVQKVSPGTNYENGDFKDKVVEGYVTTSELNEAFCEEDCTKNTVALFVVVDEPDTALSDFTESYEGNTFVSNNPLGFTIGCVIDGSISYWNASGTDEESVSFSDADSTALLDSAASNTVFLSIDYSEPEGGRGADNCYSHMFNMELL